MLSHALQLFSMALKSQPAGSHILENCWSCANDLVWLILSEAAPVQKDQQWAVELAQQATQAEPQNAAYWTTLGAASLCAGEPAKALAALERSMSIRDGGTGFDHVFLALAKARLDERDQARVWLNLRRILGEGAFSLPGRALTLPPACPRPDPIRSGARGIIIATSGPGRPGNRSRCKEMPGSSLLLPNHSATEEQAHGTDPFPA